MTIYSTFQSSGISYFDYKDLTVQSSSSQYGMSSNFSATFDSPFGRHATDFIVGNEIKIYAGSTSSPETLGSSALLFKGVLEQVSFSGEENTQEVKLNGRDYTLRLQDITVPPSTYTNSEISSIVKNIIQLFVPDLTVNNVQNTGVTLQRIAFAHDTVFQALTKLAQQSLFIFYVDQNKDLHFVPQSTTFSNVVFDNTNVYRVNYDKTRENFVNTVYVYGDRQLTSAPTQVIFVGSGTNAGSAFTLTYKPSATNVRSHKAPGSTLVGGILNMSNATSGQDYYVSYDDKQIVFASGTNFPNYPLSGGSIVVDYARDVPIVKFGTVPLSILQYGQKTKIIHDKTIKDPTTALKRLQYELTNSQPLRKTEIEVQGWYNLTPTNTVFVNVPNFNLGSYIGQVIDVKYDFKPENVFANRVITVQMDNKIIDITDKIAEIQNRLTTIENLQTSSSDIITRIMTSTGSAVPVVSGMRVFNNPINDSFIVGHPINGVVGMVNPSTVGSLVSENNMAWVQGNLGFGYDKALSFGTGYIYISGLSAISGTTNFSISAWIKTTDINNRKQIFTHGSTATNTGVWFFINSNNNIETDLSNSAGPSGIINITDGNWHHVVVTNNNGSIQNYVDNTLDGNAVMTPNISPIQTTIGAALPMFFPTQTWYFSGLIDDVRIYNKQLNSSEVGSLYSKVNYPKDRLIAYYKFDENNGSFVYNSASVEMPSYNSVAHFRFNQSGTTYKDEIGSVSAASGIGIINVKNGIYGNGSSVEFSQGNYLLVLNGSPLVFNSNNFSISVWVYPYINTPISVCGKGDGANLNSSEYVLRINDPTFTFWLNSAWRASSNFGSSIITPINTWTHISSTYNNNTNILKLFANGSLIDSLITSGVYASNTNFGLTIGQQGTASVQPGYYFSGLIDELRIYKRELNQTEIGSLYAGKTIQPLLGDRRGAEFILNSNRLDWQSFFGKSVLVSGGFDYVTFGSIL